MDSLLSTSGIQANFSADQNKLFTLGNSLKSLENKDDLKKNAKQLESVFFKSLLQEMDKTIDRSEDNPLGGGSAEETFRGMLNDQIADSISNRPGGSGFGLADTIYQQLALKLPASQQEPTKANPYTGTLKMGGSGQ